MTDIGQYLDFIIAIFFAFGIAFEVPVATFLLILAGATTADKMARKRPYIIVGAFVIGMMLTPPDVISQSLLAIPMWALFEIGLIMSRIFIKPKQVDESHPDYQFHDDNPDNPAEDEMESMLDEMEREEKENLQRPD
jgi:sec-independent protein translocase protein TatC